MWLMHKLLTLYSSSRQHTYSILVIIFNKSPITWTISEVTQSCLTLCDPVDCNLPGSSIHGIFQATILEWVAIFFSRGSSQPRDQTQVSCIKGEFFTIWATKEVKSLSCVWLFLTPWTVTYQALPSMGFSRQEYWSGLSFPSPGDLPNSEIEPRSSTLQADILPFELPGKPRATKKAWKKNA